MDCSAGTCYRTIALNDTVAHTILDFQRTAIRDVKRSLVICRCNGVAAQINAQSFAAAAVSPVKSETDIAVPLEVPPVASDSVIASSPRVVPPPYCCQSGCRHYADCHTDCQCHTNQSFFHLQKPPYKNMFCRSAPAGKPDASVAFLSTVDKSSAPL